MLDFYIRGTGQENGVAAGGRTPPSLLALGRFLAGVHLEWPFGVVGLLLAATLVCVAEADEYLWLILLIGTGALVAMAFMIKFLGGPWCSRRTGPVVVIWPAPTGRAECGCSLHAYQRY